MSIGVTAGSSAVVAVVLVAVVVVAQALDGAGALAFVVLVIQRRQCREGWRQHQGVAAQLHTIQVGVGRVGETLQAVYPYRYWIADGGLVSYGFDNLEQYRGAASYVDRILRGTKPGDLPVQAPNQVRVAGQPQDRQGDRADDPGIVPGARRRGDRVSLKPFDAAQIDTQGEGPLLLKSRRSRLRSRLYKCPLSPVCDGSSSKDDSVVMGQERS
jgi:hypothetical protein